MTALVFAGAWSIGGLAVLAGLYHFAECHQQGCRRLGRFKHGHLRLCHRHHPRVPDDGRIDMGAPIPPRVSLYPEDEFIPRERPSEG